MGWPEWVAGPNGWLIRYMHADISLSSPVGAFLEARRTSEVLK